MESQDSRYNVCTVCRNKPFTLRAPPLTKQSILGEVRGRTPTFSSGCTQPLHHIIVPSARSLDDCRRRCKHHERLLQAHTRQIRGHLRAHRGFSLNAVHLCAGLDPESCLHGHRDVLRRSHAVLDWTHWIDCEYRFLE